MSPRRRRLVGALAVVAAIAAAYGRTVGHGFAFDDQMLVVDNPFVGRSPWRPLDLLWRLGGGFSYRPLRVLSYQLDHAIAGGLSPAVFHASNLVWHAAAALALLSLARATLASEAGALVAALVFAVHPLGSEAVAYVAGRRDLLCGLLTIVALRAWWWFLELGAAARRSEMRAARWRRGAALAATALAGVAALGAKETAVVLPVLAALLALVHARREVRRGATAPARALDVAALAGVAAALLATTALLYADRIAPIAARVGEASLAPQPALTLRVLGRYVLLALWPVHLSADYREGAFALPTSLLDLPAVASALVLAAIAGGACRLVWRGSIAGFGLLWFLVALLPVAQIVPYAEVVAEHNAYLGLPGLGLAAGELAARAMRVRPRAAVAAAAAVIALLGARSYVRAGDWRDDATLWAATVREAPGSLRANYNLGVALVEANRLLEGRSALAAAHAIAPRDREVALALAGVETRLGDHDRARALARAAVAERRDARALVVLGWAELGAGDATAAAASFEEALAAGGPEGARRGLALARRMGDRP